MCKLSLKFSPSLGRKRTAYAACPGFTATNLNNFKGTQTVEQAAREPVRLSLLGANDSTGTFWGASGPIPGGSRLERGFNMWLFLSPRVIGAICRAETVHSRNGSNWC